jgi:hypothetical protein
MPTPKIFINAEYDQGRDFPGIVNSGSHVYIGEQVQLDAMLSGDTITAWSWAIGTQPAGTPDVIASPRIARPTFTPTKAGRYSITLRATTRSGQTTTSFVLLRAIAGSGTSHTNGYFPQGW